MKLFIYIIFHIKDKISTIIIFLNILMNNNNIEYLPSFLSILESLPSRYNLKTCNNLFNFFYSP